MKSISFGVKHWRAMLLKSVRVIVLALLMAPVLTFAQGSLPCAGAPADAVMTLPPAISQWIAVECGKSGHVLIPAAGYQWHASSNGRAMDFPALGLGRIPANTIDGVPLVVSRSGVYPPLIDGSLMSPHDAFFLKSQLTPFDSKLLSATDAIASAQRGYAGPYTTGYLFDVLSNQEFQYRLYIFVKDDKPHLILALFEAPRQPSKQVTLLVSRQ